MSLRTRPLTADAFAPFGWVISAGPGGSSANQGTATRFDFCADLVSTRPQARSNLAVFRAQPRTLPLEMTLLERHPYSTQVFIPMQSQGYLVVVAPTGADGRPVLEQLVAFTAAPNQAIAYAPGTWHHPMAALDAPADFTMLVWEDGTAGDCEPFPLATPIRVERG